jgi:hypothetical protein
MCLCSRQQALQPTGRTRVWFFHEFGAAGGCASALTTPPLRNHEHASRFQHPPRFKLAPASRPRYALTILTSAPHPARQADACHAWLLPLVPLRTPHRFATSTTRPHSNLNQRAGVPRPLRQFGRASQFMGAAGCGLLAAAPPQAGTPASLAGFAQAPPPSPRSVPPNRTPGSARGEGAAPWPASRLRAPAHRQRKEQWI